MIRPLFSMLALGFASAALATPTTITFSESQSSATGFNGQSNPYLTTTDGAYRVEFFWLGYSGHDHVSGGVEYNHNNNGNCQNLQGVYIERVDGASFDLTSIDLYGQATIGTNVSSSGSGNFTLYSGTSGSSSSPGTMSLSGYTSLSHVVIGDSGCGGGSGNHSLDNVVLNGITDADGDGYTVDVDCDDSDASINPGATEYCDTVDNNCDGTIDEDTASDAVTWYADADADGYGDATTTDVECYQPTGYVADNTDCNDSNNTTYPTADEYCDGIDNNCSGTTDEDTAVDASTWYADSDSDGYGDATTIDVECYQPSGYVADNTDCNDSNNSTYPGADEYCDGHDDNCDGDIDEDTSVDVSIWYADSDSDGYGDASTTDFECYQPSGYVADDTDCDDTDADTYPGADEWCDGHDDNCDGITDEDDAMDSITWYVDADGDGEGDSTISADSCYGATGYVENSTDCDDTDAVLNTADIDTDGFTSCDSDCNDGDADINVDATEIWYDGVDQNCDAWSDYDQDADGFDHLDYNGDDCDDLNPDINVDAAEIWYDDIDQNCDTLSDYDADYDGQDSESYGGKDCNDADPDTYTGAPDTPYDGVINDCDNANDNDADGDGAISADYGGKDCDDANSDINPSAEEIWYDGVDQDCDGNDDDQDGDGYALDADCDDENADVFENCDADTGGDTGGSDTGDGYDSLDKDSGGCFSSTTGGTPAGPWALLLAGLLFFRRETSNKELK